MKNQIVSGLTALALVGLLTGSQAHGGDNPALAGYGSNYCANINADVAPGTGWAADYTTQGMMSWMQGFTSGANANAFKGETHKDYYNLGTISKDEQWGYVLDFCRRNPNQLFVEAVLDLMAKRLEMLPMPPAHQ